MRDPGNEVAAIVVFVVALRFCSSTVNRMNSFYLDAINSTWYKKSVKSESPIQQQRIVVYLICRTSYKT